MSARSATITALGNKQPAHQRAETKQKRAETAQHKGGSPPAGQRFDAGARPARAELGRLRALHELLLQRRLQLRPLQLRDALVLHLERARDRRKLVPVAVEPDAVRDDEVDREAEVLVRADLLARHRVPDVLLDGEERHRVLDDAHVVGLLHPPLSLVYWLP